MSSFDAELKDSKRRAEEMQQAPCIFGICFWPTWDCGCLSQSKLTFQIVWTCFPVFIFRCLIVFFVILLFDLLQSLQWFLYLSRLLSSSLNPITLILYVVKWNILLVDFELWNCLIMFHLQMCHGSSLLEEFFAGKAFQEVKEKAACTDAKNHRDENRRTTSGPVLCEV